MTDPNVPDPAAQPVQPTAPAAPAAQPAYTAPAAPAAAAPVATGENPGKTLGIVGLILSIFFAIVGLIVSIVGLRKSKKAGFGNGPAVAGIVIGILGVIGWLIFWGVLIAGLVAAASVCADLGPGVHDYNGVTVTCS